MIRTPARMQLAKQIRSSVALVACVASFAVGFTAMPGGAETASMGFEPAPVDSFTRAAALAAGPAGTLDVVVTLDRVASPATARRLAGLATWSWAFRHVPAAGLRVPVGNLDTLRAVPGLRGVYLERPLGYDADESHRLLATDRPVRQLGVTGKGVTIAVLDSGVDFTHPDLAPAMRANVKLVGFDGETPVVPVPVGPDSDTSSGHGTHVAGAAAGRGTASGGRFRGIAPGADLVGIGAGDGISVFHTVEGFDWILEHKDEYGIRVVNNSWGTGFMPFDSAHPIQVATQTVADAGIVVLFSMGNRGDEMTMNPYAAAPWVIPVAAGSQGGGVTGFSSAGIEADVLGGTFDGADVRGDPRRPLHMGLYHPAVTAPGEDIVSTRARGTVLPALAADKDIAGLSPSELPYYTTMSGTSMATPELAGLCALILEADPNLTPAQVRTVLQVTARPIPAVPFEKQGYGYADASAAVDLALSLRGRADTAAHLEARQVERDRAVLDDLDHPDRTLAFLDYVPAGGDMSQPVDVPAGSRRLKVTYQPPADAPTGRSLGPWELVVTDAAGQVVGTSAATADGPKSRTAVDLALDRPPVPGGWAWGQWRVSLRRETLPSPSAATNGLLPAQPVTMVMVAAVFAGSAPG
jgi:serine protease AprX